MSSDLETAVIELAAKMTVVLACSWVFFSLLSKRNPRWQVWLWRVTTVAIAALIIAAPLPSMYGIPLLPASRDVSTLNQSALKTEPISLQDTAEVGLVDDPASRTVSADSIHTDSVGTEIESFDTSPSNDAITLNLANDSDHASTRSASSQPMMTVKSNAEPFPWLKRAFQLYLVVASLLLFRLVIGLRMASREVLASSVAPLWIQDIARQLHGSSKSSLPQVRVTARLNSPALCGLLRKTILLPQSMFDAASTEREIRGAIAHELAHAAGNDLVWDTIVAAITAVAWPIPLAWGIRSAHRTACERVSDRTAVDCLGDLAAYQRLVARIALRVARTTSDVGLAMARTSEVRQRLASLANCPRAPRLGGHSVVLALVMTAVASVLGVGSLAMSAGPVIETTIDATDRANEASLDLASAKKTSASGQPSSPIEKPEHADARVRIVAARADNIFDDLKWMIEQSPTADLRKQWMSLKDNLIDAFIAGVDITQPLEMDLVLRDNDLTYETRVPIVNLSGRGGFMENLQGMGFRVRELAPETFFSLIEKGHPPFYLRYDQDYAWTSNLKDAISQRLPAATDDMSRLLDQKMDLMLELKNDPTRIAFRRDSFQNFRKRFETQQVRRVHESEFDYQRQQLTRAYELDEAERLLAETELLQIGWKTAISTTSSVGRGRFAFTPFPGTSLHRAVEQFAIRPSQFANLTLHPYPLISAKLNLPFDALRVEYVRSLNRAIRSTTDSQHAATQQATNHFCDLLDATLDLGHLDAFIDAHGDDEGRNTVLCGVRVVNVNAAEAIIQLLPQLNSEWQVAFNAHQHNGVSIHELTVPAAYRPSFQMFLKNPEVVYVGTSPNILWSAAGWDGLNQLKTAIDQSARPAPTKVPPVVASYQIQVAELMKLLEVISQHSFSKTSPSRQKQPQQPTTFQRCCALAQLSMGNSTPRLRGELKRVDNRIEGFMELNEPVMAFIGTLLADSVKQLIGE